MSIHYHVETKLGRVEYYLNPEYIFSTQQMWIIRFQKDGKKWYKHYFFNRNYKPQEIKKEVAEWVNNL